MRIWYLLMLLPLLILPTGCSGDVSASHRIDTGVDPKHQDSNVRFRTTYYFRVFDVCDVLDEERRDGDYGSVGKTFTKREKGTYKILNDSLYRFRMTGKASAMFQNVIFESGTLRAEQIDPFGSSIDYDGSRRKFVVHSAAENKQLQRRANVYNEVQRLYSLRNRVREAGHTEGEKKIEELILQQLDTLITRGDVGKTVSIVVATTAAKESVRQTVGQIQSEPDMAKDLKETVAELANGLSQQGQSDPLVKSASDLTQNLKGVMEVFNGLIANIDVAIEKQQQNRTEVATKDVDKAVFERNEAAQNLMKAETQLKLPELPDNTTERMEPNEEAGGTSPKPMLERRLDQLSNAEKQLIEKSHTLKDQSEKLKHIDDAIARLKRHKHSVENERNRVRRAMNAGLRQSEGREVSNESLQGRGSSDTSCADGKTSRRGFQVLGPEGFRSFDQDERLVMALAIDSKPLIGTLQQLSDQRFISEDSSRIDTDSIKLEQTRLRSARNVLMEFENALKNKSNEKSASDLLEKILEVFNSKETDSFGTSAAPGLSNIKKLNEIEQ